MNHPAWAMTDKQSQNVAMSASYFRWERRRHIEHGSKSGLHSGVTCASQNRQAAPHPGFAA